MLRQKIKKEVEQLDIRWNKLIFLCLYNPTINFKELYNGEFCEVNINLIVSEGLIEITKKKYPLQIENIINSSLHNQNELFYLNYIDILFSPELRVDPIRLLENLSKSNKIIVNWPGNYLNETLNYAEYGHPEYYECHDFKGKVIEN